MKPFYSDDTATLWHGDMREVIPALDVRADCIITDPPYGETSLTWDRWPEGWPALAAGASKSMWCFGSMRMFLDRRDQFGPWQMSQDIVWEKQDGSGFTTDRFRRVHEFALHFYLGSWSATRHEVPRVGVCGPDKSVQRAAVAKGHHGVIGASAYVDDGTRLMRSVIQVRNMHGRNLHPTEKPPGILAPLIEYACPPGGVLLDPFAGSGSAAVAARLIGRRAVLIEADERFCEVMARRLSQDVLPIGGVA